MIQIGTKSVGAEYPVTIIAEAAVEHCGSLYLAMRMVDVAAKAGVDIVKFQYHMPDDEMLPNQISFWGGSLDTILNDFNLTHEEHVQLVQYCRQKSVQYLCTPFCPAAVIKLNEIGVEGYKTGSGELTNLPLFEEIAHTGKPVIVSVGMSTWEEIDRTSEFLNARNVPHIFLNCTSVYPCPDNQVYLKNISALRERYNVAIGHSDHTADILSSVAAVALGAVAIEKHFTLSRHINGPDASVSLEPEELASLVKNIRRVELENAPRQSFSTQELETKQWANHSLVSTCDIKAGEILTKNNIAPKRPGGGISAALYQEVLGKRASKNIANGIQLLESDIC